MYLCRDNRFRPNTVMYAGSVPYLSKPNRHNAAPSWNFSVCNHNTWPNRRLAVYGSLWWHNHNYEEEADAHHQYRYQDSDKLQHSFASVSRKGHHCINLDE